MLSSGPSGFRHAPITKFLFGLTILLSLINGMTSNMKSLTFTRDGLQITHLWKLLTNQLFFQSNSELIWGSILLYYFRVFERQMGSSKFGAFAFTTYFFSTLTQLLFMVSFRFIPSWPSGPYALLFACMVNFFFDIPATSRFKICGISTSDKVFVYILSIQLMFADPYSVFSPYGIFAALSGILTGAAYRTDLLKLKSFKFPKFVIAFFRRFLLPLLDSDKRPNRRPAVLQPNQNSNTTNTNGQNQRAMSQQQQQAAMMNAALQQAISQHQQQQQQQQQQYQPPSEQVISTLTSMGFSRDDVLRALRQSNNDVNAATNILLDG